MLFVSPIFIGIFLPATLLIFYFLDHFRPRLLIIMLLISSLFFCAENGLRQSWVLALSIFVNFTFSRFICDPEYSNKKSRKTTLAIGIFFNLFLLGYFKYAGFIVSNINYLFETNYYIPTHVLPVGISFYTFTQIAFLVDVYKGNGPKHLQLSRYALFVTYFPHVVAGPIIHWKEMMGQFYDLSKRSDLLLNSAEHRNKVCRGFILFGIGLSKKIFMADQLSPIADLGFQFSHSIGFSEAWTTSLAYTFQLYFDFSGYSDMAIGISLLFGILLPENFNAPYQATSVQDFWRRWHITLSRWLREYIYFPLGGNRQGLLKNLRNLIITFFIGGIWHGASWTFIVWGLLHGLACSINRFWSTYEYDIPKPIAILITFLFVNVTWVFFRAPDLSSALAVISAMINPFRTTSILSQQQNIYIIFSILIIWLAPTSQKIAFNLNSFFIPIAGLILGAVMFLSIVSQNSAPSSPFLYFNF